MMQFILGCWQWILLIIIIIALISCLMNQRSIKREYPNLQNELKKSSFQLMNIRLTDHYIVIGDYFKKVVPYKDIESCEEVEGDMYYSSAGKAILLHLKNGKNLRIGKVTKRLYKKEYPELQNRIRQQIV